MFSGSPAPPRHGPWGAEAGPSALGSHFTPRQAAAAGIDYDRLQTLLSSGIVERVQRGLYRRLDVEATEHHSLAAACARVPNSVVCLLSALRVHGLGTRVPREVWLAIPHKARPPRPGGQRLRLVRFVRSAWTYGVAETFFEGVPARITNPARTVVDCFRFRRIVSRETAMEALRDGLRQRTVSMDAMYRVLDVLPSRRLKAVLEAMPP